MRKLLEILKCGSALEVKQQKLNLIWRSCGGSGGDESAEQLALSRSRCTPNESVRSILYEIEDYWPRVRNPARKGKALACVDSGPAVGQVLSVRALKA